MAHNEADRIGLNELNNRLQNLIKAHSFTTVKTSNDNVVPTKMDDTLIFLEGSNISIVGNSTNRSITINLSGTVPSAEVANSVLWSNINGNPVDWIIDQGVNYSVYNSERIDQWGYVKASKDWTTVSFPIQFRSIANIAIVLTPISRDAAYSGSSPINTPGLRNITKNGFDFLLTVSGTTWDCFYYAIAK